VGMEVRLSLSLPSDSTTVPLIRRVLDAALAVFSVTSDCRADIGLAVGEACANAVEHADTGADYEVTVTIQEDRCIIDVLDDGNGMEGGIPEDVPPDAESGRGLKIIHALADMVELRHRQPRGMALRIVKLLTRTTTTPAFS
jgi:serine/threonine-protein kinase RsbW